MSTKLVLATAALAALAATTEARPWSSTGPYNPNPRGGIFEEENDEQGLSLKKIKKAVNKVGKTAGKIANGVEKAQAIGVLEEEEWEMNAGISGSGGRPTWNVGVSHKWENENELQDFKADLLKAAKVIVEANEMGIFDEDAVVEEGLKKVVKKAVKVAVVASQAGLLEDVLEDEEQSVKKIVKKAAKVAVIANEAGLFEEWALPTKPIILPGYPRPRPLPILYEEEAGWEVGAGISGSGGKPTWNVGVRGTWEEENDEQGLSLKKIKKAVNKVGKTAGKIANGVEKAQAIGVLEEEEWEMNAGISGSGGRPTWNVGVSHKWEEENDEQGLSLKKIKKAVNKVGKTAGKIANGVEKAQQIGVLEEEEWEMNAGISGSGGRPTWNVGVSHKWDDEAPVARRFAKRFTKY